jgi:hypothetical protein
MSDQNYNQSPPPPPGYGQQTSSLAVISLIAGIASYFIIPFIGAIAAIITGNMAKKEIHQSAGRMSGLGMAKWGVILGWINVGLSVAGLCLALLSFLGVASLPFCLIPFSELNY